MANENTLQFDSPGLFIPSKVRGVIDSGTPTGFVNFDQVSTRNIGNTSSFRYDAPGAPLRSTQQIPIDFSDFKNHTFFQSAQVNVHLAIDKMVNEYPFDATQKEIEEFLDSMTGFEKYVNDSFPHEKNFLFFSGVNGAPVGVTGTFVEVKDFAGTTFPSVSRLTTGENVLDPSLGPISFEMQILLAEETNGFQVVFQKLSGSNQGITMFVSESASASTAQLYFAAVSGSSFLQTSASIDKGEFNHVAANFQRRPGTNKLELWINEVLIDESINSVEMGVIDFNVSPFFIGSGSAMAVNLAETFTPAETLSGALDEFRVFHEVRTVEQQKAHATKAIFAQPDLKLYFRFNEPAGLLGPLSSSDTNRVVLDYSGNSLHSLIASGGFNFSLRESGSVTNPMANEKVDLSPVLFPNYPPIATFNIDLLSSASIYDKNNPNLITRLIPPHYFTEGRVAQALDTVDGTITDIYSGSDLPGSGDKGEEQVLQSLLYIWAKFFDEMKIYMDVFAKSMHVGYDTEPSGTLPDQFLPQLAASMGVSLPNLFTGASVEQFIDAENLDNTVSTGTRSLQSIQNQIWRRLLTNIKDIIASKGTLHSVKSFIRTLGIDPDGNFRIREFGGPTKRNLSDQREVRTEVSTMLDMSGTGGLVVSPLLSASRTEIGFPDINGTYVNVSDDNPHGVSNDFADGFLTSGSFTVEAIYKFPLNPVTGVLSTVTQSLGRIQVLTGTINFPAASINVVAISGSDPQVRLFARPGMNSDSLSGFLTMSLAADIFDGNQWGVSFGRFRADDPVDYLPSGSVRPEFSSSYFLRVGRADRGIMMDSYVTQSFFQEASTISNNSLSNNLTSANASGSILVIGSQSLARGTAASDRYLSDVTEVPDEAARATAFDGKVGHIRFWSKGLLVDEWKEHVRNFKSLGVVDPLTNFNFETVATGAFNRLRIDASTDQAVTESNASGDIEIFDFSQNTIHLTGSNFEVSTRVIKPETFYFGHISPKFDEASTTNKVRSRGFLDFELVQANNVEVAPVFEINPNEQPMDDVRFTIDFSVVDALDQDIISIFSTLEEMDTVIGDPTLMYAPDYPGLEDLRNIYFNRLTDKINLKSFFEFFKWFDRSIGHFIESLIPRKTRFRGVNFVIESHMLERGKYEHLNNSLYLNAAERHSLKGTILLQQLLTTVNKY